MPVKSQLVLITTILFLAACGQQSDEPTADPEAAESGPAAVPEPVSPPALTRTQSAEGARVFFLSPADGSTVSGPVSIEFGIEGMQVVRAGDDTPASGHHHLLVDTAPPDLNLPVPADANHIHFGDASTSTVLELDPGEHTLQLLLGDHLHIPHEPPVMSEQITITVE